MIAKIGRSGNLYGALAYNNLKVEKENGEILLLNRIIENESGSYTVGQLSQSFELYLIANRNTEKHTLHISLNPDPKDQVSDEQFREMALEYMKEMGYGEQPFIVFKHTDIDRAHIHIVSVCIDEKGRKISDKFEKRKSMQICRDLENKYDLIPAIEKARQQNDRIFKPVDYKAGNIKSQIASVIRHLPKYYQFQTLGEYNALLSLFNITTEKVEGELNGELKKGLLYFPTNGFGDKAGNPFKASLFGNSCGLENYFEQCKSEMANMPSKQTLKSAIAGSMNSTDNEHSFKKKLIEQGINVVVRRNNANRIYGITFIDHNSKTVWNGSKLGKELSANAFQDLWSSQNKLANKPDEKQPKHLERTNTKYDSESPHHHFDFLNSSPSDNENDSLLDIFSGLLPDAQGEDYEELEFANRMKKKKKKI